MSSLTAMLDFKILGSDGGGLGSTDEERALSVRLTDICFGKLCRTPSHMLLVDWDYIIQNVPRSIDNVYTELVVRSMCSKHTSNASIQSSMLSENYGFKIVCS